MAQKHFKEPPTFGTKCRNFSYWKQCMQNYLDLIDVWSIVETCYEPKYENNKTDLTAESKVDKVNNSTAVNAILNSVSEQVAIVLPNTKAKDINPAERLIIEDIATLIEVAVDHLTPQPIQEEKTQS